MMPQTISAMRASLIVAGSPSSHIPNSAVPTVPMPVHGQADDHRGYRQDGRQRLRESVGVFEADRPADLEQASEEQEIHDIGRLRFDGFRPIS